MPVVESKVGRVGLFLANPMVAKLNKIEETENDEAAAKGIALFFLTANLFPSNYMINIGGYDINYLQAIICFRVLLVGCIDAFIVFKFVKMLGSLHIFILKYKVMLFFHLWTVLKIIKLNLTTILKTKN